MRYILILSILSLLIAACGNNDKNIKEEKEDDRSSSLVYDDVTFLIFDTKDSGPDYRLGSELNIRVENLQGFNLDGDKIYPGARLILLNSAGDTIQKSGDVYESKVFTLEMDKDFIAVFYASILPPLLPGNSYTVIADIWDKKGDKTVQISKKFNVIEPLENGFVNVEENGISPEYIITYKDGRPYSGNTFAMGERVVLRMILPDAFLADSPAVETYVSVTDKNGDEIFSTEDSGTLAQGNKIIRGHLLFSEEGANYKVGESYQIRYGLSTPDESKSLLITMPVKITE